MSHIKTSELNMGVFVGLESKGSVCCCFCHSEIFWYVVYVSSYDPLAVKTVQTGSKPDRAAVRGGETSFPEVRVCLSDSGQVSLKTQLKQQNSRICQILVSSLTHRD